MCHNDLIRMEETKKDIKFKQAKKDELQAYNKNNTTKIIQQKQYDIYQIPHIPLLSG